jgi:hypothetical protein
MKPVMTILKILCAALSVTMAQATELNATSNPPTSVCGRWVVKQLLLTTNVQTSPASLRKYLGYTAEYSASEMRFGKSVIPHPSYSISRLSESEFFSQNTIPLSQLGISDKAVDEIVVKDSAGKDVVRPGADLFVRNRDQLITQWDGGYFVLVRKGTCTDEK